MAIGQLPMVYRIFVVELGVHDTPFCKIKACEYEQHKSLPSVVVVVEVVVVVAVPDILCGQWGFSNGH